MSARDHQHEGEPTGQGRHMAEGALTPAEMVEELGRMVWSKRTWLSDFGAGAKKRPDHEVEAQRRHLEALQQAERHYQQASRENAA